MDPELSFIINDVIKKSQLSSYRLIMFMPCFNCKLLDFGRHLNIQVFFALRGKIGGIWILPINLSNYVIVSTKLNREAGNDEYLLVHYFV